MRKTKLILGIILILAIAYFSGPKPKTPIYSAELHPVNSNLQALSDSIDNAESANSSVKLNNQARIIWADSTHSQTEWAIVYLHGFSASQMEGYPIHALIAKKHGMNLYLARLSDHGLVSDSALYLITPDRLWETSKLALSIGQKLGKKVILMSTSTGGTLALKLAEQFPNKVNALINYSPNIRINNPIALLMNNPWGNTLLQSQAENGYFVTSGAKDSIISQYWNTSYRTEALTQLEELVETTMIESVFKSIKCPSLTMAYYKDEDHQDPTVKVSAMEWMHDLLGTDEDKKRFIKLSGVGVHPFASGLRSKDLTSVEEETSTFIEEVLRSNSVN